MGSDCHLSISTKSKLILRDIELLKSIKDVTVSISINTLNEKFKDDMDRAGSIKDRIYTLRELHESGIKTVLFMSPIFPYITEQRKIINITNEYVDQYWFENLNLRGEYKKNILYYINKNYSEIYPKYVEIYDYKNQEYWQELSQEIEEYCTENNINYINYFYHKKLVAKKKERGVNIEDKKIQKQRGIFL